MGTSAFYEDEVTLEIDEDLAELFNKIRVPEDDTDSSNRRKQNKNSGEGLRKIEMYLEDQELQRSLNDSFWIVEK